MSNNFSFNAPTYFDFNPDTITSEDKANVETYFEIDHENSESSASVDVKLQYVENESYKLIFSCQDNHCNLDTITSENKATPETYFETARENSELLAIENIKLEYVENESYESISSCHDGQCNQDAVTSETRANPETYFETGLESSDSSASVENESCKLISLYQDDQCIETSACVKPCYLRKSLSAENLLHDNKMEEENKRKLNSKIHRASKNRSSTARPTHTWKEHIDILAQPKQMQSKYVSTSELVNKFYDTPERFHTWRKKCEPPSKSTKVPSTTIPQSPYLIAKHRHRAINIPSRDEIEAREIEENKKFKIKANPVNHKILQGPVKPIPVVKKPSTVVEPFNLTETHNKKVEEPIEVYEFHAKPAPKTLYDKPKSETDAKLKKRPQLRLFGSVEKLKLHTPKPITTVSTQPVKKTTRTAPMPFSFEARDKNIAKRREEMINKVLDEEKRAREFHANPPPKYIFKKSSSLNNLKSNKTDIEIKNDPPVFKARPPVVLYQKPFEPKKPERTLIELTEVCLNTDRRAKEREEFEKKIQDKMNFIAMEKNFRQEEQERFEQEEIARLRKETVHVAQPVRHYKEVKIEPSGKVTTPITPNLRTTKRCNEGNKENTTKLVD